MTRTRAAGHQGALVARMKAVLGAQQALAAGERVRGYALRQALIDLLNLTPQRRRHEPGFSQRKGTGPPQMPRRLGDAVRGFIY